MSIRDTDTTSANARNDATESPPQALLWVLRDKLGTTGPEHDCGLRVGKACTCVGNGKAVQRVWLGIDVPKCGFCQPGQIMAASAALATPAPTAPASPRAVAARWPPAHR